MIIIMSVTGARVFILSPALLTDYFMNSPWGCVNAWLGDPSGAWNLGLDSVHSHIISKRRTCARPCAWCKGESCRTSDRCQTSTSQLLLALEFMVVRTKHDLNWYNKLFRKIRSSMFIGNARRRQRVSSCPQAFISVCKFNSLQCSP